MNFQNLRYILLLGGVSFLAACHVVNDDVISQPFPGQAFYPGKTSATTYPRAPQGSGRVSQPSYSNPNTSTTNSVPAPAPVQALPAAAPTTNVIPVQSQPSFLNKPANTSNPEVIKDEPTVRSTPNTE